MSTAVEAVQNAASPTATFNKGLLLSGTAPGEPGVGGVILKDLILHSGVDHWHCCWLAFKHGPQEPYWKELRTTVQLRQYETGYRPLRGIVGEAVSATALRVFRPRMIRDICQTLLGLIKDQRPDFLLTVLDCPAVVEVMHRLQTETTIPVRCIVWDDVDVFCRHSYFDRWTQARIERTFGEVLKRSERTAVICENMQAEYQRRYGIDSFILRHGLAPANDPVSSSQRSPSDVYRIGFAGSVTAPDCMRLLIEGLDSVGWKVNGREVVLRLLGARYLLDSRKPQRIEYFGWRSVDETRARLAECDLLYLPQSFTQENRLLTELSFPTKLSTYIAARQPILLHAPAYGSLMGFWQRFDMGPVCGHADSHSVLSTVTRALSPNNQRENWITEIIRAHEQALGVDQFHTGVDHLLALTN